MKYSVDKQKQYSVVSVGEDKLDAAVAPDLKSELITMHAEGVKKPDSGYVQREIYRLLGAERTASR